MRQPSKDRQPSKERPMLKVPAVHDVDTLGDLPAGNSGRRKSNINLVPQAMPPPARSRLTDVGMHRQSVPEEPVREDDISGRRKSLSLMAANMEKGLLSEMWFVAMFGFKEGPEYDATRRKLRFLDNKLRSLVTGRSFYVGPFDLITLIGLREKLVKAAENAPDSYWFAGDLSFQNVAANTRQLHQDYPGAVFQVSSNANCLETKPGRMPEDGITCYCNDRSQGADCAMACPAATVFRNYFVGGTGQGASLGEAGNRLDCLEQLSKLLNNSVEGYWVVQDGLCVQRVGGRIALLSRRISCDPQLTEAVRSQLQVGVHWDTEVENCRHRICQVFCCSLPIGVLKSTRTADWAGFATTLLEMAFEATLTVASILATQRGQRIKVFLTPVGIELENKKEWIATALDRALSLFESQPLDVILVHPQDAAPLAPDDPFAKLQKGRRQGAAVGRFLSSQAVEKRSVGVSNLSTAAPSEESEKVEIWPLSPPAGAIKAGLVDWDNSPRHGNVSEQLHNLFDLFDQDGNGQIDRHEFMEVLRMADASFFTPAIIAALLSEIDSDHNGTINYKEFINWIFNEDCDLLFHLKNATVTAAQ